MATSESMSTGPSPRTSDGMAGLAKGMAVLETFGAARSALTISDVARLTGLSKPAARRCLLTLAELGYLSFDGKRYLPTMRVMRLGAAYLDTDPFNVVAQPHLDALRDHLQESVALIVWDEGETVVIARADANRVLAFRAAVGRRMPAYATSSGRVLMAEMTSEELDTTLALNPPIALAEHTVTDPRQLRREIARAGSEGYALVNGEIEAGFLSLAAPVRDGRGRAIAALTVNSTSMRVSEDEALASFLAPLLETATRIGQLA